MYGRYSREPFALRQNDSLMKHAESSTGAGLEFRRLQWLFPIALALHNTEEAIWMPSWAAAHAASLPLNPPGAGIIWLALLVLTLAGVMITYLSARKGPQSLWAYLLFGYIVTMFANVIVPHVPAAIRFRGYAPGVVTAVLVNLPVMTLLSVRAVRERWVSGRKAVAFGVGVPLFLASVVLGVLASEVL